jgi:hypothetical protein
MKELKTRYLSHGIHKTGGAIYEEIFCDILVAGLKKQSQNVNYTPVSLNRIYKGLQNFSLLYGSFKLAKADINMVVSRMALGAICRRKKTLIFIHNYDPGSYISSWLKMYYRLLFACLRKSSPDKVGIIVVAPYWYEYFKQKFPRLKVFLFPNLFETAIYITYRGLQIKKQIHLGQFSPKNDPVIFKLAKKLYEAGFHCYFSSLDPDEARQEKYYSVKYTDFETYLEDMAESEYTLALTYIKEGWNRMAHESLLVGTPVLGYNLGGLGDLLQESASIMIENVDQAFNVIMTRQSQRYTPSPAFETKYDLAKGKELIQPVIEFLLGDLK